MNALFSSISSNPLMFLAVGLYLVLMAGIGIWSRRTASLIQGPDGQPGGKKEASGFMVEYFLAGRGMGGLTLAMAVITTYTSASSFIGGPGVAYTLGLGWVLLAMIQVPTTFLTLGLMGKRLAAYSRATGAVTISDFLQTRYGSRRLTTVTSVLMLVFFVAVMLAQFIGGARVLEAATGLPYAVGLAVFGLTVVLYTAVGGFRAVVLTDLVQGFVMVFAAVAVLWAVVQAGGGMEKITQALASIDPGLIRPSGPENAIPAPFMLSFWVLVGIGVLGLPQTAQKCMAFKDDASLRNAMLTGTVVIGFTLLCTHLAGAFGRAVLPGLPAGDLIMPTLIITLMPPFLAGVFIAGTLAAIMSTVSSMLIIASATIIRDLYVGWRLAGREDRTDPALVRKASMGITAFLGVMVCALALNPPDLLVWINLFAFGGLEAVFLWPVVLGLYWKEANAKGALCSVLAGVGSFAALSLLQPSLAGVHPVVPSLALAGAAFFLGNRSGKAARQ